MRAKYVLGAALLTAAMAAAFADNTPPAPAAQRDVCLRNSDVDGWGSRDDHSMVVNDRFGRKYLVSLAGMCSDLNYAFRAGFRSFGGGMSCISRGDHVMMGGAGIERTSGPCWVNKVLLYTGEMETADHKARENHQPLASY
jgi:hypothetical protein